MKYDLTTQDGTIKRNNAINDKDFEKLVMQYKENVEMKSMVEMQREVDEYIGQFKTGYFSPLANLARLTEEVGELAREINHTYGEKKKKDSEEANTIKAELGDNLFVLLCLANSMGIDMTESFNETMEKFNTRDKNRFERK